MIRFLFALAALVLWAHPAHAITATITSPANNSGYTAPAGFTVSSYAAVLEDGEKVTSHKIYRNGVQIASGGASLSVSVSGLAAGTYYFSSQATNNMGQTANSAAKAVTVVVPGGFPPTVSLGTPTGAPFIAPATVGLSATASDDLGVTKVEFIANGSVVATDDSAPYQFTWGNVAAGSYTIAAKAYDGNSLSTTSNSINVTVEPSTVRGNIDAVQLDTGVYHIRGWACSSGRDQSIDVHLYVGGPAGSGTMIGGYPANLASEPAVASACQASGTAYRFSIPLSAADRNVHANKKIYIHGISPVGQPNLLLSTSGVFWVPPPLSASRHYVYDANQQLCKTIEPETGATVMDYDAAGNLQWSASGLTLTSTGSCDTIAGRDAGRKVTRYYDSRNRITSLTFPDGVGDQSWSYTPDGLPANITTFNSAPSVFAGSQVINAYTYNHRRLLTGESSTQLGWYTWGLGYSYNGNAHLQGQTYPSNLYVDYAPNALGQPTKAGTYASGVSYYPNGGIKQFTYGNGIVHSMVQNARQLPQRSTDVGVIDDEYGYDANGNVDHVYDFQQGSYYSRWMTYDGLDRLTGAMAGVFGGTDYWHRFTYDALDNIKSWKLAGVKDYANYYYDPSSNRLTNIQNSSGASIVGLAYDVQGNLQNKNGQNYVFDYGNRMRDVSGKESYRYDGYGRRVLAHSAEGNVLSQYGQDGVMRYQSNERKRKGANYIYLGGSLVAIHEMPWETVQVINYQHTDALGSPVAVTNESGQVVERTQYEPFGAAINKTVDGVGYTGHVMDAATGLTYMQQRYYDPTIGRFLSVDPVTANSGTGANFNRYWYANNNPYKFTDPDGREAADRAYGAVVAYMLRDDPEKLRIWAGGEAAATTEGSAAEQGAAMGQAAGEFIDKGDFSKAAVAGAAVKAMAGAVTRGKSGRQGDFTRSQQRAFKRDNAARNGGQMKCDDCGKGVRNVASEKGVKTPSDQAQVHHDPAIKDGGGRHSEGKVLCPECHQERHRREK